LAWVADYIRSHYAEETLTHFSTKSQIPLRYPASEPACELVR